MRRLSGLASAFVLVASLAPAQDVGYTFDQQADFARFKTYKWMAAKDAEQPDEQLSKRIMDSVDRQLATKGLTRTDSDSADLYVAYQAAVSPEKQLTTMDTSTYGGFYGMSTAPPSTIQVGTVVVDMYDRARKQLVWRGTASKQFDPKATPERRQKNLDKAMHKLLTNYPPRKK